MPHRAFSLKLKDPLFLVAVLQLWGAATGVIVLWSIAFGRPEGSSSVSDSAWLVSLFLALVLYTLSGLAGVFLLRGSSLGLGLTIASQVPQLVHFAGFSVLSGASLVLYFTGSGLTLMARGISHFELGMGVTTPHSIFGFNLLALAFILCVTIRLRRLRHTADIESHQVPAELSTDSGLPEMGETA